MVKNGDVIVKVKVVDFGFMIGLSDFVRYSLIGGIMLFNVGFILGDLYVKDCSKLFEDMWYFFLMVVRI